MKRIRTYEELDAIRERCVLCIEALGFVFFIGVCLLLWIGTPP